MKAPIFFGLVLLTASAAFTGHGEWAISFGMTALIIFTTWSEK